MLWAAAFVATRRLGNGSRSIARELQLADPELNLRCGDSRLARGKQETIAQARMNDASTVLATVNSACRTSAI